MDLDDDARDYVIEPYYEARSDPLLSKYKIETFLVSKLLKVTYICFSKKKTEAHFNNDF